MHFESVFLYSSKCKTEDIIIGRNAKQAKISLILISSYVNKKKPQSPIQSTNASGLL